MLWLKLSHQRGNFLARHRSQRVTINHLRDVKRKHLYTEDGCVTPAESLHLTLTREIVEASMLAISDLSDHLIIKLLRCTIMYCSLRHEPATTRSTHPRQPRNSLPRQHSSLVIADSHAIDSLKWTPGKSEAQHEARVCWPDHFHCNAPIGLVHRPVGTPNAGARQCVPKCDQEKARHVLSGLRVTESFWKRHWAPMVSPALPSILPPPLLYET